MTAIDTVLARMEGYGERSAIFWRDQELSYTAFLQLVSGWESRLSELNIIAGTVCAVVSDYSPQTAALFFALMRANAIVVPFLRDRKSVV